MTLPCLRHQDTLHEQPARCVSCRTSVPRLDVVSVLPYTAESWMTGRVTQLCRTEMPRFLFFGLHVKTNNVKRKKNRLKLHQELFNSLFLAVQDTYVNFWVGGTNFEKKVTGTNCTIQQMVLTTFWTTVGSSSCVHFYKLLRKSLTRALTVTQNVSHVLEGTHVILKSHLCWSGLVINSTWIARLFSRWCVRVQSDNSLQWDTVKPWGHVNGLTRAIYM